jgi:quinol monooxygenase YgiN
MYVVFVEFRVEPMKFEAFLPLMLENARCSRDNEPGCHQFDVCVDRSKPGCVFLYELYDDESAFKAHVASSHFKEFDAATKEMITEKFVQFWQRIAPQE